MSKYINVYRCMPDRMLKQLMQFICGDDERIAFVSISELCKEAKENPKVYHYMDLYFKMLSNRNPSLRRRGIIMIKACAKWDSKEKIAQNFQSLAKLIYDRNKIVAIECINCIPELVSAKPEIALSAYNALTGVNVSELEEDTKMLLVNTLRDAAAKVSAYIKCGGYSAAE